MERKCSQDLIADVGRSGKKWWWNHERLKSKLREKQNSSTFHFSAPLNHSSINVIFYIDGNMKIECVRDKWKKDWRKISVTEWKSTQNRNWLEMKWKQKNNTDSTMKRGADDIRSSYRPLSVGIDYNFMKNSSFFLSLTLSIELPSTQCHIQPVVPSTSNRDSMDGYIRNETFLLFFAQSLISISCHFCLSTSFETSKLDK